MSSDIPWLSIKEASSISGRSVNSLNLLVNRHRIDKVKMIEGKWHIHRDSLVSLCQVTSATRSDIPGSMSGSTCSDIVTPSVPLEHYEKKRTEWDNERDKLQAGLMMYRWKYEELEQKIRLLPAPVEVVSSKLTELEEALQEERSTKEEAQAAITRLEKALETERSRSWWKRLFGLGR
jgi:hypothetical protein